MYVYISSLFVINKRLRILDVTTEASEGGGKRWWFVGCEGESWSLFLVSGATYKGEGYGW